MGVKFDRVLEAFDAPTRSAFDGRSPSRWRARSPPARAGYLMSHERERRVHGHQPRLQGGRRGVLAQVAGAGRRQDVSGRHVLRAARRLPRSCRSRRPTSASASPASTSRPADAVKLSAKRIALADRYGGSMPSGWTRLEFENFEIPFTRRVPEGSRRRQPQVQVRRDHLPVRHGQSAAAADVGAVVVVAADVAPVRPFRPSSRRCRATCRPTSRSRRSSSS